VRGEDIIDPTWADDDVIAYCPGLQWHGRQALAEFVAAHPRAKQTPFFYEFGWGGMHAPSFRECYEEAMKIHREAFPATQVLRPTTIPPDARIDTVCGTPSF